MTNFEVQLFKLKNYTTIQRTCKTSLAESLFFIIAGETGTGKTVGLKKFSRGKELTIKYIRIRESMTSNDFFKEVALQFEHKNRARTTYNFMNWIRDYIINSKEKFLLIIDEGGKFKSSQYSFVHELRDLTEDHMGIIMAGPKYFVKKLRKWNEEKIDGIPEFFRRVNMVVELKDLTDDEKKSVSIFR